MKSSPRLHLAVLVLAALGCVAVLVSAATPATPKPAVVTTDGKALRTPFEGLPLPRATARVKSRPPADLFAAGCASKSRDAMFIASTTRSTEAASPPWGCSGCSFCWSFPEYSYECTPPRGCQGAPALCGPVWFESDCESCYDEEGCGCATDRACSFEEC